MRKRDATKRKSGETLGEWLNRASPEQLREFDERLRQEERILSDTERYSHPAPSPSKSKK